MGKKGISHLQHKAIIELISPGNKSLSEVAKRVGVTTRTIRNWNRNLQFQKALSETMDDLRKTAISDSLFALRIEAMVNMVKHEVQVVENFDIKGAIIRLGESQALLERQVKANSEELESLRNLIRELGQELGDVRN